MDRVKRPETHYALADDAAVAYQVFGEGRRDLVFVPGIISHIEQFWEDPHIAAFLAGLARGFRVIQFDKRGLGLSDRLEGGTTLDARIDDLNAVMATAGSRRATLIGLSEGGPMSMLFAATYPEKVERLILIGSLAKFSGSEDYPHRPRLEQYLDETIAGWGKGTLAPLIAPARGLEPGYERLLARLERMTGSPGAMRDIFLANDSIDVRPVLPEIRAPTLIIHRHGDRMVRCDNGRYLADHIPRATYLELPGRSHAPWLGNAGAIVEAIHRFAAGAPSPTAPAEAGDERRLATALFTDIVGSTEILAALGDAAWRGRLDSHDAIVAELLETHHGRLVKNTGDGILALFDGPARAVACARALVTALAAIDLRIRAGLHVGEVVERAGDVTGLAVNIAARVMELAASGEVLLTRTLADLTGGSGLAFEVAGSHELKGVPGVFEMFRSVGDAR